MDVNNYLWYPYLRYQQECRENGKEDSIQEWLELTGKVTPPPVKVTPKKVTTTKANTKRVRNRNAKGHYVKDDPNTAENEAWKVVEIAKEIAPKIIPYKRRKKAKKTNKKKE